jgi:anti-sigma regulatory factor (Ser/Thr protein kinase)
MSGAFHGELTLPNQVESLAIARSFLEQLADMAALPERDRTAIVGAVFEACANVVDHAYEPGENGTLTITADLDAAALTVAVRDHGLPIDIERVNSGDVSPARVSASGGLAKIRHAVDHAEWVRRGRDGKELRLVKRRPVQSVHGHLTTADEPVEHGPSFLPDGDALCLQRLATELDFDYVEVENPFARELLDYVRADRTCVLARLPVS